MKKIIYMIAAALMLCGCNDNVSKVFDDYFVYIVDEYGASTSKIEETADDLTMTYYICLVAPTLDSDVTVGFEVTCGDGLKEGVDFEVAKSAREVTISRGVARMPVRITFNEKRIDPARDNTVTIRLTDVDRDGISLGYPGPSALFSAHTITKIQEQ
ncbi:MAG: hypothetical protein MJZ04_05960 [Bacteroidales bacterium]|nr:hypothetical protein [Bacteroidales bacterium]